MMVSYIVHRLMCNGTSYYSRISTCERVLAPLGGFFLLFLVPKQASSLPDVVHPPANSLLAAGNTTVAAAGYKCKDGLIIGRKFRKGTQPSPSTNLTSTIGAQSSAEPLSTCTRATNRTLSFSLAAGSSSPVPAPHCRQVHARETKKRDTKNKILSNHATSTSI